MDKNIKSLKKQFKKRTGYNLNIENPLTYCEKIQWRKVHDRRPILPQYADKIAARDIAASILGTDYLVPSLCAGYGEPSIEKIKETMLGDCVIKMNHGCGWMIFQGIGGEYLSAEEIQKFIRTRLGMVYGADKLLWAESQIPPGVIVERYVSYHGSLCPLVKVYCFDGKAMIGHCLRHGEHMIDGKGKSETITYYDAQGSLLDLSFDKAPPTRDLAPPEYRQCIELSERISGGIDHVRVDWLLTDDGPKFSEFTWHSWNGMFRFFPLVQDMIMGDWWTLPKE